MMHPMILRRRRISGSGGGGGGSFDPTAISGLLSYGTMATVYQDQALTTAAALTDPVGGMPDLTGNGYLCYQAGAARPVLAAASGVNYAQLDGTDDRVTVNIPSGARTTNMVVMLAVEFDPAEDLFNLVGITSGNAYAGLGQNGGAGATFGNVGTAQNPTYKVNGGAVTDSRDALSDAATAARCIVEVHTLDMTGGSFVGATAQFFGYGGSFLSNPKFFGWAVADGATISSGDLDATRAALAAYAGVTL